VTKLDVLAIVVFSTLALGLVAMRLWGAGALRDLDGILLVFCAAAGWLGFAAFIVDEEPARGPGARGFR
jgi:hypothetical protein